MVRAALKGNLSGMQLSQLKAELPGAFSASGGGELINFSDSVKRYAQFHLQMLGQNLDFALLAQWGLTVIAVARGEAKAEARQAAEQHNAANLAGQSPREYVLEVIGLGVSLDKYRQGRLWDTLQKGNPFTTIREMDPQKCSVLGRRQARCRR